ncbi:Ig-like domain-containing domain [Pedobacter sp. UC225_65]|uniref:Ig-like domain-containing domain n=1 Tax=Pedobacter sp. UC225_65 TaxID=3350173 RepID=UPI0036701B7C
MRSPEGGPKDTTPPKVLKMEPKNYSTNFNAQKITIEFDEYFNLQNEFKEVSVSPEQDKPLILKKRQKKLEITFQDSLEKNTTYTINFGKAIADVNEGNIIKNLSYVFATGPKLDSLSISGKVINTLTGKPELDATVFILPLAKDSIFGKKKPSIYTTTDSSGNYTLSNLKKETVKIYALKETGGDKIYQQATDQIGFIKAPIELTKNIENVNIGLFKELASTFRIVDRRLNTDGSISFVFNQQLVKPELVVIDSKPIDESKIVHFTKNNDSAKVWLKDLSFDSLKFAIKSDGKALDTVMFTRGKKDTYTRIVQLTDNLEGGSLNPYKPYRLFLNSPIDKIDLTKIKFLEDSIPRTNFTLEKDSSNVLAYVLKYPWKKARPYIITFGEGTFTELFGTKNKEIKRTFKLANADDYGSIILTVEVPEPNKSYVIELVNEKKDVVYQEVITKNTKVNFINYRTGIYFVRVIYDDNKNGKWDTGNVKNQTQPEKIWYEPEERSIRANWTREHTMIIPKP